MTAFAAASSTAFLRDGGELGGLLRARDWTSSTLGHPKYWAAPLKTSVRLILNCAHPMYIFWGPEARCFYNDAYRRTLGPERHPSSIGEPARTVWAEIWDTIGPQIDYVMRGEGSTWQENQLIPLTRHGRSEDVYWTYGYSPIDEPTAQYGVGGVLVICNETTEAIMAQQRVWNNSRDLQVSVDLDGVFLAVNPAWTRTLGHSAEETLGRSFTDFIYPDDSGATRNVVDGTIAGHEFDGFENRFVHKDGGFRWISWHTSSSGGNAYGSGRDVTVEKEAAAILARAELQQRAVFETSHMLQGMLDPKGIVLHCNATALGAIGARLDEVVGKRFDTSQWFAGTPGASALVSAAVRKVAAGESVRRELHLDMPVEGWRWYDFAMRPMLSPDGKVVAIVPEALDITERKATEEALRQSQKLEAMGQLTGGVAHDFNNLLTPIVGSLDMLQRRGLGGVREQRLIDGALQSAERAKTLVQRLLAFARRQPLKPVAVDVGRLVGGIADLVGSASSPRVQVVVDIDPGLPPAVADPNQLEMALLNLSVNARDAMPGGGTLTIAATHKVVAAGERADLPSGPYIRLAVADTGVGMDAATCARAIEPFFTTKGIGKGTGLGLSMVHGLTSQLGGALAIDSVPGEGTVIELWLPAGEQGGTTAAAKVTTPQASGTVLLVDDEDLVRISTAEMLIDLGFAVIEAASAADAIALLDARPDIDLLITDHLMPEVNGDELVRRATALRPGLRAAIISGFAELEDIPEGLPRLAKPFRRDDLAALVEQVRGEG